MDKIFVPRLVYENVILMMKKYRRLDLVSDILPEDQFRKDIQYDGVIRIEAKDSEGHRPRAETITHISIMGVGSKYIKTSAEFKRHVVHLIGKEKKKNIDIMIISHEEPSSHIKKKIIELSNAQVRIYTYLYDVFKAEIPMHKNNAEHILMNGEEVEKIMNELATEPHYLPKMRASVDPTAIWYGFEPGDIVRIKCISEISGIRMLYKLVV